MSEFKRLRKKNKQIKEIDRSGVTRIKDGWWIRLGWENKRPRFQKVIWDKEFAGNHIKSYLKAIAIARENRPYFKTSFKQPTNFIKGVALSKQRSKIKTAKGHTQYYYCWKYAFTENDKAKGRTFSFWKTGQIYETFLQMIGFALQYDKRINLNRLDDYFQSYLEAADGEIMKDFLPRSDIDAVHTESDRLILKNRYLKTDDHSAGRSKSI